MAKKRMHASGKRMLRAILHPAVWKSSLFWKKRRGTRKLKPAKVQQTDSGSVQVEHDSVPAAEVSIFRQRKRKSSSSASRGSKKKRKLQDSVLDPSLWENLPEGLVERILSRLPIRNLLECRTVCKLWNSFVLSPSPVCPLPPPPPKTTLLHFPPGGDFRFEPLTVYNNITNSWDTQSLAFLSDGGISGAHSLVAADGGLLCFCDTHWRNFVVCNPISRQWKLLHPTISTLPRCPGTRFAGCPGDYLLVGLIADEEDRSSSYRLILANLVPRFCRRRGRRDPSSFSRELRPPRTTLVYNSRNGQWSEAPPVPLAPLQLESGAWTNECPRRGVACNGKICWSVMEKNDEGDSPVREIVQFDVEKSKWCNAEVEDHAVRNLITWNGKALLVKLCDGIKLTFHRHRAVGALAFFSRINFDICPSAWECRMFEVGDTGGGGIRLKRRRIPRKLCEVKRREKMISKYDNQYACIGQGPSLFVMHQVIDGDFTGGAWEMLGWKVLHFDSSADTCVWLPQFDTHADEQYPLSWWTLQPSLWARV